MPQRVLVIDDDPGISMALMFKLEDAGYTIETANSGQKGLELAQSFNPEVILLDIRMPGMDGLEVCKRLKDDPATAEIPVIFLTANAAEKVEQTCRDLGGHEFISKPFESSQVIAAIEAIKPINSADA